MNFEFFLSKISPLGDYDQTYGQRYWGEADGILEPISFNSQQRNIQSGQRITAEEKVMKKSSKGTEYWQLKKVKVIDSGTQGRGEGEVLTSSTPPASKASQNPGSAVGQDKFTALTEQLGRMEGKLDKLLANDNNLDVVHEVPDGDPPMPEDFLL